MINALKVTSQDNNTSGHLQFLQKINGSMTLVDQIELISTHFSIEPKNVY